jgi:curli biogenesis system outer membrane secretion channel CsgG
MRKLTVGLLAGAALGMLATDASAATAQQQRAQKQAEMPRCAQPIGNLAVQEPERNWWSELHLGSPEALLKVFVQQSGCFSLVDRGAGLAAAQRERALASGGNLQQGSNVGGGQIVAADFVLVPDIVSQNANASGNSIGGALGGFLGRSALGALAGSLSINSSTADVTLAITNVRTTQVLATIDGHSTKTDVGFGVGGGIFNYGGFGAAGATGYNNTEIGQVITLAYLDAYTKLVDQLGGLAAPGAAPAVAAVQQMVVATRATSMFSQPSSQSQVVRPVDQGMRLYPTGNKNGLMWEVKDELGNTGWVSSIMFELAK